MKRVSKNLQFDVTPANTSLTTQTNTVNIHSNEVSGRASPDLMESILNLKHVVSDQKRKTSIKNSKFKQSAKNLFEHKQSDPHVHKQFQVVQKQLKLGPGLKFQPTSEYEARLLQLAMDDRKDIKPPESKTFQDTIKPLKNEIRKGATRPANGGDLFRTLLENKNDPKFRHGGIGNAATGMTFKSIYLGQGRSDSGAQAQLQNPNIDKNHKLLYHLHMRPDEPQDQFFMDNIYTCEKFKLDLIQAHMMRMVRHEDGVKLNRSLVGSPNDMIQYQKDVNRKARIRRNMERMQRNELRRQKREHRAQANQESVPNLLLSLEPQNLHKGQRQLYNQNFDLLLNSEGIDLNDLQSKRQQQNKKRKVCRKKSTESVMSTMSVLTTETVVANKKNGTKFQAEQGINEDEEGMSNSINTSLEDTSNKFSKTLQKHYLKQSDWQVSILKLQKVRPKNQKTLLETQDKQCLVDNLDQIDTQIEDFKFLTERASGNTRTRNKTLANSHQRMPSDSLQLRLQQFQQNLNNSEKQFIPLSHRTPSRNIFAIANTSRLQKMVKQQMGHSAPKLLKLSQRPVVTDENKPTFPKPDIGAINEKLLTTDTLLEIAKRVVTKIQLPKRLRNLEEPIMMRQDDDDEEGMEYRHLSKKKSNLQSGLHVPMLEYLKLKKEGFNLNQFPDTASVAGSIASSIGVKS